MAEQDWVQKTITLPSLGPGLHLIDRYVLAELSEIDTFQHGILHLFLQHTSASLMINENADPNVGRDLEMALDRLAPEDWPYRHREEGPDDMPAHIKTMLAGYSLQIPVMQGRLALGTWQGVFLCEHRQSRHQRRIVATLYGQRHS